MSSKTDWAQIVFYCLLGIVFVLAMLWYVRSPPVDWREPRSAYNEDEICSRLIGANDYGFGLVQEYFPTLQDRVETIAKHFNTTRNVIYLEGDAVSWSTEGELINCNIRVQVCDDKYDICNDGYVFILPIDVSLWNAWYKSLEVEGIV